MKVMGTELLTPCLHPKPGRAAVPLPLLMKEKTPKLPLDFTPFQNGGTRLFLTIISSTTKNIPPLHPWVAPGSPKALLPAGLVLSAPFQSLIWNHTPKSRAQIWAGRAGRIQAKPTHRP